MATIKVLNSQGTKIYVADETADLTDCSKILAVLQAAKIVGCPQSLGDLSETRTATEYKCLSSNDSVKALGGISRGSLEIGLLLDPDDVNGQSELRLAFADNTPRKILIELPNAVTKGALGHGTVYGFTASVSGVSTGIAMDAAISYTVTLEISSAIGMCAAA